MSIRLGNNIVAGRSPYQPSLFDFKWADHILTDPQWVRADTNLWHNRSVFTPAYDHLLADIQGKEAQSETIEGIIITYYLASDGHKICLSDQVDYLNALYEKTGVAWYYVIDTTTKSFKVPRSKWNVVGIRSGVHDVPGKFETFALPNAASEGTAKTAASQMYLYFYIGNFTQTAIENTAGANLADIEEVMDESTTAIQNIVDEGIEAIDTMINAQYHPNIFEFKWSDAILNDIQWLRSDTFSWQSGDVYETAYQHLVTDIVDKTLTSETISGTTISYYLADDGHKICPATQESNVVSIYESTGIAWYYILDTTNKRFKLPRTTFGFVGKRGSDPVGKYIAPGLPNITGSWTSQYNISMDNNSTCKGAIASTYSTGTGYYGSSSADSSWGYGFNFDASASNAIYGASTTVQAPATEMYLYFYVGKFLQSAIVNTAGIAAEQLNTLTADVTDLNSHRVIAFQAPTSENDYTWYRKYADGWVEQGKLNCSLPSQGANTAAAANFTLPVTMVNNIYNTTWARVSDGGNTFELTQVNIERNTTYVKVWFWSTVATSGASTVDISISGMAA